MEDIFVKYPDVVIKDDTTGAEELRVIYKNIKSQINKLHTSQVSICFYMNQIREFFKKRGENIYFDDLYICLSSDWSKTEGVYGWTCAKSFVNKTFNISYTSYFRYLKIYDTFFVDGVFDKHFLDFDISKLGELAVLPLSELIKDLGIYLKPKMTIKEIREYIKSKSTDVGTSEEDKKKSKAKEEAAEPDLDPGSPDSICNVSLNIKRKHLDFISGLGVDIDTYIAELIDDDISARTE